MFFAQRPSPAAIEDFLRASRDLRVSYAPVGIVNDGVSRDLDEAIVTIGRGYTDFERAKSALIAWKQFNVGWIETFPRQPSFAVGTVVAVLIRHLGFWSLNGCRVVYNVGSRRDSRFGFAYGTLTNHAESGEELFEVFLNRDNEDVTYRIRATSRPQTSLARLSQPFVRALQARFRRDSGVAMARALTRFDSERCGCV